MNCPPSKRLRGLNQDVVAAFDDPFGDDEDFTQDDLDEIDIMASQAITSTAAGSGTGSDAGNKTTEPSRLSTRSTSAAQNKPPSRSTAFQSKANTFGVNRGNVGISSRMPLECNRQQLGSHRGDSYSVLEAQHAELKRKLKEVEEEIVLKSGEIRVLRDSLKATQQEKEAQRQNQILLDAQKQKEQKDKEKELNKKVQSLQSELQFKEAEINEMKTKLHNSDRNKLGSPPARNSLATMSSLAQRHHGSGSSSSSPVGNVFITKEVFGAQVSSRATPVKTKRNDCGSSSSRCVTRSEASRPDPFQTVRPAHPQHRGGVLLGLLLQQPLSPSSLGLSHLLSMSLTDINLTTSSRLSPGLMLRSDTTAGVAGAPRAALSPVQSLAVTGLNMLSQNQPAAGPSSSSSSSSSSNNRSCPGAVLLLPLLDLHLSRLCQALDSLPSTSADGSGSDSPADGSVPAGRAAPAGIRSPAEACLPGFSREETGLAALRLLYLLLAHSDEVVEAVLSSKSDTNYKAECFASGVGFSSQNALLQSLLRLCDTGLGGSGSRGAEIAISVMRTLCVLTERTPQTHTDRLQCVLQRVCVCVSAESRLQMVLECVDVLASICDHQALARQLCSQHDPCVFLKLLQIIRTRPENRATHTDCVLLDLKVVRLLSRLMTQRAETWTSSLPSACLCNTELVQTAVIVFHRQWLEVRGSEGPTASAVSTPPPPPRCSASSVPWWRGAAASLLRECLLLLHWLLLHHSSFSESCRPLLHMYDQVIPAVRDTLKKIPELSESEELALEEICRSEGDDMDMDASS